MLNLEQGRVRGRALILILAVVILLILGAISIFSQATRDRAVNDPRAVADTFVELLARRDNNASYEMLSATFKETSTKENWVAWLEVAFSDLDKDPEFVKELKIFNAEETYGKGSEPVRYVYSFTVDNNAYKIPFVFVKENGLWKIAEIGSPE